MYEQIDFFNEAHLFLFIFSFYIEKYVFKIHLRKILNNNILIQFFFQFMIYVVPLIFFTARIFFIFFLFTVLYVTLWYFILQ